jgi:plastocyanin
VRSGGSVRAAALAAVVLTVAACESRPVGAPSPPPPTTQPTPSPSPLSPSPTAPLAPAADCEDATLEGALVTLRQEDNVFDPECLVVLGGQSLRIRNVGANVHNFSVEGTTVDLDLQPGSQDDTEPVATIIAAGRYTFFCKFHRSIGMEGEITITAAG